QNWEIFTADLKLSLREHPIKAELLVDLKKQTTEIKFNARTEMKKMLNLIEKSKQLTALSELKLAGLVDVKGNVSFGFSPWTIKKLMVSAASKNCEIHYGTLSIRNKQRLSGQKIPLAISVSSNGKEFIWKLKSGLVKSPVAVYVRELSCFVSQLKGKVLRFAGEFEFDLARLRLYNIKNAGEINLVRKMTGRFNRITKNWQLQTAESGSHARKTPVKSIVTCGDTKIFADISELGFKGRGCGQNGNLAVKMLIKEISATGSQNAFFCNNVELDSNFQLIPASNGKMRIKKNHFKFVTPELFSSSLERQVKIKDLTINGSNSFDGFKMNGFEFTADSEDIKIKQNHDLLTGKNNKLTFDGVFQKSKKTWELAITTSSAGIVGKHKNNDFSLRNAQSKNFLSLDDPLFNWSMSRNCNLRLKCDAGEYGNEKEYLKFSGFNIGTALILDAKKRWPERTFNCKIAKVNTKYQDSYAAVSKLELAGRSEGEQLTSSLAAKSISVQRNNIKYFAELIKFNLTGKTFNELMLPKYLQAGFVLPSLLVSRGKEQVKIVNTSLKADASFYNDNSDKNWHRSLKNINLELVLGKISGIWKDINILSTKTRISARAETGLKNSVLYFKKLDAGVNVENTVAYSKSWKLASRGISVNSTTSGTIDSKLILKPNMKLRDFYISSRDTSLSVPEVSIAADLTGGKVSGTVSYDKATFQKNKNLVCRQISVRLPFGDAAAEGEIAINKIELRKRNLGKVSAKLQIKDDNLLIKGSHFSEFFSNAGMFFSGRMKLDAFPAWEGDFSVPEFKVKNAGNARIMFPVPGLDFVGKVTMEGHLEGDLEKCKGSGVVSVKGGNLSFNSWKLSDVTTTCTFTDLFNAKSAARQKLHCGQVENDSIKFSNMKLEFQSHGMKKLQVERLSVEWFGGRLTSLTPFSIENNNSIPGKVNFLSSKITLSPFLDYLGVKGFATDAFVGGIIPFSVKDNKVLISGAFLATSASRRGFLCMNDDWSKYIEAGADESRTNRKKFTAAALKRFNYNWIRLNVTTTPEMSSVDLSIDGYPAKAVPFKYDIKKALFEPVSADEPGLNNDMTIETKFIIPGKVPLQNKKVLK
ncbi:MAG: YdbH domain-containing protein, partial [Victivallaceae bacterium]|nr:YdbH domain-containing protein [Victivallaceae bacterium]